MLIPGDGRQICVAVLTVVCNTRSRAIRVTRCHLLHVRKARADAGFLCQTGQP